MFSSSLAQEMTAYIDLRIAAFSDSLVSNDKRVLLHLDQHLVQIGFQGKNLTEEVLSAWAKTLSGKSKTVKEKLGVVRGFGKYLNTLGYDSFLPTLPKVKSNYIPYIFSDEEVALIFHYAEAMPLAHIVEHFLNAFGEGQQNFSPSFMHTIEKGSPLNSAKNSICKLLESLRFHTFIYFLHIKNTTKPLSSIVLIIYK